MTPIEAPQVHTRPAPDALVIGAGVIGLATAWELVRRGLRVTVIDRHPVGRGGASWASGGILGPMHPADVTPDMVGLLRDSVAVYADWCAELQAASGVDPEYLRSGLQLLGPVDTDDWTGLAAAAALSPVRADDQGGLDLPAVAQVRPPRLLRALAAALTARGAELVDDEAVTALPGEGAGAAATVRTERGQRSAGVVVLAAGAWSAGLCPQARVQPVHGEMLLYAGRVGELQRIVLSPEGYYLIPRADGSIVAGSTLQRIGFDDHTSAEGRARIAAAAQRLAPWLAGRELLAHWSGLRPESVTGAPQIGWVAQRPRLLINAGHYRLGVTLAPGSARRVAGLVDATLH